MAFETVVPASWCDVAGKWCLLTLARPNQLICCIHCISEDRQLFNMKPVKFIPIPCCKPGTDPTDPVKHGEWPHSAADLWKRTLYGSRLSEWEANQCYTQCYQSASALSVANISITLLG